MRCFVAVPVPAVCRELIDADLEPLRRRHDQLRWTASEGWHVTLAFLGELDDSARAVAAVSASAVGVEPFELATTRAGRFGDGVLWLGVEGHPPGVLDELVRRVCDELAEQGMEIDSSPLRPHVTLARSRRRRERVRSSLVDEVDVLVRRWRVERIELWRSVLGRGPARYEVVASAELGS